MKKKDLNTLLKLLKELKEEIEPQKHLDYFDKELKSIIWSVDNYIFQSACSKVFEEVVKDMQKGN
jgi:hypothetical protein